ncbi:MAG TPA: hydantoinase/oxoprolinase N-terminal domain-containing protein [Syntrophomonas sp.]|nr:hydantoinase/oxoprolinase N-terminal domain-containing protein [Syntrophomonas sp.]
MLIGIDVGGTFTDGVLFDNQHSEVVRSVKVPTSNEQLQFTLLEVLDRLLLDQGSQSIQRIVLSTTLVTNLLATNRGEPPALVLIPGPGLPPEYLLRFPHTYIVQGSMDFRGRETEKINQAEIETTAAAIRAAGIGKIAVVGKFSNRNAQHEQSVRTMIKAVYPEAEVGIGSELAGQLNFLRRIATSYYSLMTRTPWTAFARDIERAMADRNLDQVPLDILKADGGTMPLRNALQYPCETILSGPAASTMGARAVTGQNTTAVVMDIGGTTTDISLLLDGQPLYASRGARINGSYTHIKAISTRSLPLGGDSPLGTDADKGVVISPVRKGPAACFGGENATVTDVFNCKYHLNIGDMEKSYDRLQLLQTQTSLGLEEIFDRIEKNVMEQLQDALENIFAEWENEPAYRVWEVVHGRRFEVRRIIGIGAAAAAIVPPLAEAMKTECFIHELAPIANALGAAVARPTLAFNLHIDTEKGSYFTDQDGLGGTIRKGTVMQLEDAQVLAGKVMKELAERKGLGDYGAEAEFTREEQFNMIRGWDRTGKIFELGMQIKPGFIKEFKEGSL